jgi:hypothetical protein
MFGQTLRGLLVSVLVAGSLVPAGLVQAARHRAAATRAAVGWYWQWWRLATRED